jgi:molecular chaperone GrpE
VTDTTNPNDLDAQLDEALANAEAGLDGNPDDLEPDNLAPLDAMIADRDLWKDRALRAAAEADNVKRRTETQMNDARAFAIQRFAKDLLGVADNLERALMAAPKDADGAAAGLINGLLQIDNIDPVTSAVNVRLHLWVPAFCLVTEVNTCF